MGSKGREEGPRGRREAWKGEKETNLGFPSSPPPRLPRGLLLFLLLPVFACDETSDTTDPVPCACDDGLCDDDVCDVSFVLPAACAETFSSATVTVGSDAAGSAVPGQMYDSCEVTIPAGAQRRVRVQASGFDAPVADAVCDVGGQSSEPVVCTLRFELSETCDGLEGRDTATVAVDGVAQGVTTLAEPLVPCLWLEPGDQVSGTIRSGSDLVATVPLTCTGAGGELRFVFECPR